jgi:esterase
MAVRRYFDSSSLCLSYLDFGGEEQKILLALHGHYGNARMFSRLAEHLKEWHVMGLDQRGHGWSEHSLSMNYSRDDYVNDIYNFVSEELAGKKVVLLGHSLGGVNAYQFAAKYPALVEALIIEDIGTKIDTRSPELPSRAITLSELRNKTEQVFGKGSFPYFAESVHEYEDGWGFRFHQEGISHSHQAISGDWSSDWLSSECPLLLIHGCKSWAVQTQNIEDMDLARPNVTLVKFPFCGHTIHDEDPIGFQKAVDEFLRDL